MAPPKLTSYEQKRLDNIKRNQEMIAALNINSKITQLTDSNKRQKVETKTHKAIPMKRPGSPVVARRSLRARRIEPESEGLKDDDFEKPAPLASPQKSPSPERPSPHDLGPLKMTDAFVGEGSNEKLIKMILDVAKKSQPCTPIKQLFSEVKSYKEEPPNCSNGESNNFVGSSLKSELDDIKHCEDELSTDKNKHSKNEMFSGLKEKSSNFGASVKLAKCKFQSGSSLDLASLSLNEENIARLVPGRIMSVKFMPSNDLRMVIVGDMSGNVAFWNMESNKGEDADDNPGIFLYKPHLGSVSGIAVQQPCLSKIFSSCYDGFVRLMDAEKEVFDLIYSSDDSIFSLAQRPNDAHSLYFAEGLGMFNIWDVRTGKCFGEFNLHTSRINTIDFSSTNNNIMATSSSDGTACIWDVRCMDAAKPKALKIIKNEKPVHSAYFSPSGSSLATTSLNGTMCIVSGSNFEDTSTILHDNRTGTWISNFRATWGWDDSYLFVGNMNRGVDVISPTQRRTIFTLVSPNVTTIPCRFDAHPYQVGMLAGAAGGGHVYVWTS